MPPYKQITLIVVAIVVFILLIYASFNKTTPPKSVPSKVEEKWIPNPLNQNEDTIDRKG